MTFIDPTEYLILCDNPALTVDDLKRLRDAGIRTAFNFIGWETVETAPGVYDWSSVDAKVERLEAAGIKSLLRCYDNAPAFFPDDWYLRAANGTLWRNLHGYGGADHYTLLSPWCKEASAAEYDFEKACRERYHGHATQCFAGGPHGGEVVLPGMIASYCDEHALVHFQTFARARYEDLAEFNRDNGTQFLSWDMLLPADLPTYGSMQFAKTTTAWLGKKLWEHVKNQQEEFPEIWLSLVERNTPFAEAFECGPRSGNWLMGDLCNYLPDELHKPLNILLWEVWRADGQEGALSNVKGFLDKTWIGSQFCEGLYRHTDDAIKTGLRGFITSPINPMYGKLENWMLDAIRWSLAQWKAARG